MEDSYHFLIKKLDQFIQKFYLNELIRGSLFFLSISLGLFLVLVAAEYLGQFDSTIRTALFYSFIASELLLLAVFLVKPLYFFLSVKNGISRKDAAKIIGNHFEEVADKLENILDLANQNSDNQNKLIKASIDQKIAALKPIPFNLAINFKENIPKLKYLIPPALTVLAIYISSPNIILDSTNRLVAHNLEFIPKAPFEFTLENADLIAYKNEDFQLELKTYGREIPQQVKVVLQDANYYMNKNAKESFNFTFKNLQEDIEFYFEANGFRSKSFYLSVLPKPSTLSFSTQLDFPNYLKLENKTLENTGNLTVPEGTNVKWTFQTEATDQLNFIFGDSAFLLNPYAQNEFETKQSIYRSTSYKISGSNSKVPKSDTVFYSINVIPDQKPSISVEVIADSIIDGQLDFIGRVKDDYGFKKLVFHRKVISKNGDELFPVESPISINTNLNQSDFYYSFNANEISLEEGDELYYFFEIWDNDEVNGSKSSRSITYTYKLPSASERNKKEEIENKKIKDDIDKSISLAKEIKLDLKKFQEKLLEKKSLGFQEKKLLEEIQKKQAELKKSITAANEKNKNKNESLKNQPELDESILEKQAQLEQLFEQVMSEEMKEMMAELEKLMEESNKDKIAEQLEEMELSNQELEKELDRNLELFKQLAFEKNLDDIIQQTEKLKEEQEKLNEDTKNKNTSADELQKRQEEINKSFDNIEQQLDELKKENEELEQPNEMPDTESLEEAIKEDLKESAESLKKQKNNKASESQSQAKDKMEDLAEQLSNLQMNMQSSANAENLEDLRFLLENLIQLSFDQEENMLTSKGTDRDDPKYLELAQNQKKLKDDAKIIEDSLFALSKRVVQLQSIINKEISAVNYNMEKAIELMEDRQTPQANSRQQFAMTSINNLALLLDEAIQNMQQQMSMGSGKGACKKPGQGAPSPGNMKKMQEQLNKQLQQLKQAMENGEKPGGKKGDKPGESGQGGQKGLSKQLAKMAAKQAAIREALQKMQEQLEGEGEGGSGELKKLGELMEQTETDLVNKQISNATLRRQEEILTRLLESEKAEKEREKKQERESVEFRDEISRNPELFLEYKKLKEKEIELLRTLPPNLNPFYKRKVSEYFKTIDP